MLIARLPFGMSIVIEWPNIEMLLGVQFFVEYTPLLSLSNVGADAKSR